MKVEPMSHNAIRITLVNGDVYELIDVSTSDGELHVHLTDIKRKMVIRYRVNRRIVKATHLRLKQVEE